MTRFTRPCMLAALLLAIGGVQAAEPLMILTNGDFQSDADNDGTPDGWAAPMGGVTYAVNGTNRFLRLMSSKPDEMVMIYRQVRVPKGVGAFEMTWKQRTSNLARGKQPWHDARIMLQFKNAAGEKIAGSPPAPNTSKDSDSWVEKRTNFLVPEGTYFLELMPTLFQVKSGTFEIDEIVLKATDPAPLLAAAKAKAEADAEKRKQNTEKRQAVAAAKAGPGGELIANGSFQADGNRGTPDRWGTLKNDLSWQIEGENRFLRLTSPMPGKMVMFYHAIDLPKDTKALEFQWSQRVTNFQRGKENYFDARIMFQFLDAGGKKMSGDPSPAAAAKNTDGWVEKSKAFLVPEGALSLVLMPALFQVESGTFDFDNLSLKPTDPAPLIAAAADRASMQKAAMVDPEAPNKAKWPQTLRVVGNKVVTAEGKEVWLQGVNVDSLQWNARGEQVMKSTLVATDEWKSNVLRLPIQDKFWFGKDASQKDGGEAYRKLVDDIVTLAANRGAYVMLDLHRFRASEREHIDFWKNVAAKYKDHPAVFFELFNEPHGTTWEVWRHGGFVEDSNASADEDNFLTPEEKALNKKGFHSVGMQALIDAVRSVGAKNIVVVGGLDWAYDLSGVAKGFTLDEKGGNGLMFAAHIYAQKTDWLGKVLVVADKYPIIVSECGANTKKFTFMSAESQEDAETWVPRFLGFIQKNRLHWTAFSMHPSSAPVLVTDWKYTPTPEWGTKVKRALAGESFPAPNKLR